MKHGMKEESKETTDEPYKNYTLAHSDAASNYKVGGDPIEKPTAAEADFNDRI